MVTAQNLARGTLMNSEPRLVVGEWFDEYVDTIHRYAARRLGADLAHDITADTFRTALERFDSFDPDRGQPIAWLYGIATNLIRRHARTEQRRLRNQLRAVDPNAAPLDPLIDVDQRIDASRDAQRVVAALDRLEPADRDLILLSAWEGMSSAQIAEVLGMPASSVRARLGIIRTQLEQPGRQPPGGSTNGQTTPTPSHQKTHQTARQGSTPLDHGPDS